MSEVVGLAGKFSGKRSESMYRNIDSPQPGTYVVRDQHRGARGAYVDAPRCPYCRGRLFYRPGVVMYRVAWVPPATGRFSKKDMIVHETPSTHRALICGPCEQTFTVEAAENNGIVMPLESR